MNALSYFLISILAIVSLILLYYLGSPRKAYNYLRENLGIAKGIVLATVILGGIAILLTYSSRSSAEWKAFSYTEVYLGVEFEEGRNRFCDPGDIEDRLSSNLGLEQNIFQFKETPIRENGKPIAYSFDLNLKYTHHSCVLNEDNGDYDAIGPSLKFRIDW